MATSVAEPSTNGVASVNLTTPSGVQAKANVLLAGAVEKTSHKDPDNPRPYYQVLAEPEGGGDALYIFSDRDGFEQCARLLSDKGTKVPGVLTLSISRRGQNFVAFSAGENLK